MVLLSPVAKDRASGDWATALFTISVTVIALTFLRGYFKLLPILRVLLRATFAAARVWLILAK